MFLVTVVYNFDNHALIADLPDTSIADTSTEDFNSSIDASMTQQSSPEPQSKVPVRDTSPPPAQVPPVENIDSSGTPEEEITFTVS